MMLPSLNLRVAIDFIVDKNCPVKEVVGTQGLVDLIKSRNRAAEVFKRLLDDGKSESEALDATFQIQMYTANGGVATKDVSVRELFLESDGLKDQAHHCQNCALNNSEAFGCYNVVNYPISAEAERWLARLGTQATEKGMPDQILLKFILDENVSGEFFEGMRKDPKGTFLQTPAPYEVLVEKKFLKKIKVSTDQILDMFFAIGTMERTHQMFLLFFSGGVTLSDLEPDPLDFRGDVQAAAINGEDGAMTYWIFSLPPAPSDDESISQIKTFLRGVFSAFATGETISVDY